jgi:hypothetical protein
LGRLRPAAALTKLEQAKCGHRGDLFVADDDVAKHIDDRTAVDSAIVGVVDPVRSREADTDEKNSAH